MSRISPSSKQSAMKNKAVSPCNQHNIHAHTATCTPTPKLDPTLPSLERISSRGSEARCGRGYAIQHAPRTAYACAPARPYLSRSGTCAVKRLARVEGAWVCACCWVCACDTVVAGVCTSLVCSRQLQLEGKTRSMDLCSSYCNSGPYAFPVQCILFIDCGEE